MRVSTKPRATWHLGPWESRHWNGTFITSEPSLKSAYIRARPQNAISRSPVIFFPNGLIFGGRKERPGHLLGRSMTHSKAGPECYVIFLNRRLISTETFM